MAQAILESATSAGWGSSSLFRLANNPFGIKYEHFGSHPATIESSSNRTIGRPSDHAKPGQPTLQQYSHFDAQTWEIVNGQKKEMMTQFQRFPVLNVAFVAHAQLLCSPHFRGAFEARHDWKQFAERLGPKTSPLDKEHCGYSTNPSYSAELIKLVELYRLDDVRVVEWLAAGKGPGPGGSAIPNDESAVGVSEAPEKITATS